MLKIFEDLNNVKIIDKNDFGFIIEEHDKMGFRTKHEVFGNTVLKCEFDRLSFVDNGKILLAIKNGKGGYYDIEGNVLFPLVVDMNLYSPIYSSISEGVIFVMQQNSKKNKHKRDIRLLLDDTIYYGAINSEGECILDTIYNGYYSYRNGLATLLDGSMIVEADLKGNIVSKEYRYINEFNDYALDLWTHQTVRKPTYYPPVNIKK